MTGYHFPCFFVFLFQQRQASEVLNVLREHPEAWTKVDSILEFSKCQETKYYALQILEKTIKTRWKALPKEQCEGKIHQCSPKESIEF